MTREKQLEYYRKYNLKRRKHSREYYRQWYAKNGRNRAIDYAEAIKEWRDRNPEKVSAWKKLNYEVKQGRIIKSKSCQKCGRDARVSAHHIDYSKPLEVVWVCSSCHKLIHSAVTEVDK